METSGVSSVLKRQGEEISDEDGPASVTSFNKNEAAETGVSETMTMSSSSSFPLPPPPVPPPPFPGEGDPLEFVISAVRGYSSTSKKLNDELALERQKIAVKDAEIKAQNVRLVEAEGLITLAHDKIKEQDEQIRVLQLKLEDTERLVDDQTVLTAQERKKRLEVEEKLAELKSSLKKFSAESSRFFEDVKKHLTVYEGEESPGETKSKPTAKENASVGDRSSSSRPPDSVSSEAQISSESVFISKKIRDMDIPLIAPFPKDMAISKETQPKLEKILLRRTIKGIGPTSESKGSKKRASQEVWKAVDHGEDISKSHLKGFFCICGVRYNTMDNLEYHLQTYTDKNFFHSQTSMRSQYLPTSKQAVESSNDTVVDPPNAQTSMSVQTPVVVTPKTSKVTSKTVSTSEEKHRRNITKRDKGLYYCICDTGFVDRPLLDAHIRFQNKRSAQQSSADSSPVSKILRTSLSVEGSGGEPEITDVRGSRSYPDLIRQRVAINSLPVSPQPSPDLIDLEAVEQQPGRKRVAPSPPVKDKQNNFTPKQNIQVNLKGKSDGWNFQCKICGIPFFFPWLLDSHMLTSHQVICEDCGSKFETDAELCHHQKTIHHKETETTDVQQNTTNHSPSPPIILPEGTPQLTSPKGQQLHKLDTEKRQLGLFYCTCGKNCINEQKLLGHITNARRELRFPCNLCEKGFPFKSYLTRHMEKRHKIQAGAGGGVQEVSSTRKVLRRKVPCPKCNKFFRTQEELLRHNRLFHCKLRRREAKKLANREEQEVQG